MNDDGMEHDGFYPEWKSKGLDVAVEHGEIHGVFRYNKDADGHAEYEGELPEK